MMFWLCEEECLEVRFLTRHKGIIQAMLESSTSVFRDCVSFRGAT